MHQIHLMIVYNAVFIFHSFLVLTLYSNLCSNPSMTLRPPLLDELSASSALVTASWANQEIFLIYCTVLYFTVLYCTVLYCTVLYFTVLYCTVLYCTVLYCTGLVGSVLVWLGLYWSGLYFTVLYCTEM